MGYPLLQNSVCRKNKTEIAHANDKGCGENSAQDVPPREAATVEIFVWESHSVCSAGNALDTQKFFVEQTLGFMSYVIILCHFCALPREIYNL